MSYELSSHAEIAMHAGFDAVHIDSEDWQWGTRLYRVPFALRVFSQIACSNARWSLRLWNGFLNGVVAAFGSACAG